MQRARWIIRARASEHPAYLRVVRSRHGAAIVSGDTQLVIDGFTRTATTYAVIGFQLAQPAPVRVAHHLHAAGQVIHATRLGVPTLVTLRDPEDTVLSAVIRQPFLCIPDALRAYARFHEALLPHRQGIVFAEFEEVTNHLGDVIRRVNDRFGTPFCPFDDGSEALRQACFELIELRARRPAWRSALHDFQSGRISLQELEDVRSLHPLDDEQLPEHRVARPSQHREARKQSLRDAYREPSIRSLRDRATAAHAALSSEAGDRP